jgi:hypothetical protein
MTIAVTSVLFVLAEAAMEIVSYAIDLLSIPPVLGHGALADGAILVGGPAVATVRLRSASRTARSPHNDYIRAHR